MVYQGKLGGDNFRVTDDFQLMKGGVRFTILSMKGGVRFTLHLMKGGVRLYIRLQ